MTMINTFIFVSLRHEKITKEQVSHLMTGQNVFVLVLPTAYGALWSISPTGSILLVVKHRYSGLTCWQTDVFVASLT